ncbi:unnamed protein product, partial [Ectocarpus sp. 8 AP-2014]
GVCLFQFAPTALYRLNNERMSISRAEKKSGLGCVHVSLHPGPSCTRGAAQQFFVFAEASYRCQDSRNIAESGTATRVCTVPCDARCHGVCHTKKRHQRAQNVTETSAGTSLPIDVHVQIRRFSFISTE